ncbi:hypothetical protein M885DRAFT_500420 [Pelagophyceae sp. CCMP2097]|nr:hypothetical protein M885DRAFT_500420 [Pelagophyceae sp. CCMP2097]
MGLCRGALSRGPWCKKQRQAFLHDVLPQERIERLDELGFRWIVRPHTTDAAQEELEREYLQAKKKKKAANTKLEEEEAVLKSAKDSAKGKPAKAEKAKTVKEEASKADRALVAEA